MQLFYRIFVCLKLCIVLCSVEIFGQNCTFVNQLYQNAKKIHASQVAIDQSVFDSRIFDTENDPNFPVLGEFNVNPIFVADFDRAKSLEDTTRLWHEAQSNPSTDDLEACISKADRCPRRPAYTCSRDRSFDGACNNLDNQWLGASFSMYGRIIPADFEDYVNTIRRCRYSKSELPLSRVIGNVISDEEAKRNRNTKPSSNSPNSEPKKIFIRRKLGRIFGGLKEKFNKLKTSPKTSSNWLIDDDQDDDGPEDIGAKQRNRRKERKWKYVISFYGFMFAQLVSHDMGNRALVKFPGVQCCRKPYADGMAREISNPACFPINIPSDDKFYSKYNATCLNYVRSDTTVRTDCKLGTAEVASIVSSFIDLSIVYGTSAEVANSLRTYTGGQMQTNQYNVLPQDDTCSGAPGSGCFYKLGDSRINQSPQLALLHSLCLRAHNNNADELARVNPHWSDQKLFDESRRLTIANHQYMVYYEWLPLFLGKKTSIEEGIYCDTSDPKCRRYESSIDPSILDEFMQGSYRALHVCIPEKTHNVGNNDILEKTYFFSDILNTPNMLNYEYNSMLRGMLADPIYCKNLGYPEEIRSKMFKIATGMGTDLFSIDIHRGRDHGVSPYYKYYTKCTGKRVKHWNDLSEHFDIENIVLMSKIYESVLDVDIVTGVMLEQRDNTLLGVVARCIMGLQFHRLRYGDRFFYSSSANPRRFSTAQIREIEKMTMAKFLCQNTNLTSVPENSFVVESKYNQVVSCDDNRHFDYTLWKDGEN